VKKYLLIGFGALTVCIMLIGDGIAISSMLGKSAAAPAPDSVKNVADKPAKPSVEKDVFVEIPKFVVTIPAAEGGDAGPVYLQLALSFLTDNKDAAADFGKLMPVIKAGIISDIMFSGMRLINQPMAMKSKIATDSLQVANSIVTQSDGKVGSKPFFGAYITDYINQ